MLVLGVHTAGRACDVAVVDAHGTGAKRCETMQRGQDARLPGLIQEVCAEAGVSLKAIDRFAVVTGPGSFTGVRVGVSFMRGLALATGSRVWA